MEANDIEHGKHLVHDLVHDLSNCLQVVMGYIELGEYEKAANQIKECRTFLTKLKDLLKK